MDATTLLLLGQDSLISGSIYALLAVTMVMVFSVTRVLFIPQGEFVTYGALTLAALEAGRVPGTAWLLLGVGVVAAIVALFRLRHALTWTTAIRIIVTDIGLPAVLLLIVRWVAPMKLGLIPEMILTLALVVPLGPFVYRIAFQPLAESSILVLLIVAVGVHMGMTGLGLVFFGPEGYQTSAFSERVFDLGIMTVSAQSLWVVATTGALLIALYIFFERTVSGKTLRAAAISRRGARLVGISTDRTGYLAFTLTALIGAVSGLMIGSMTTIYFDSGFIIGLKGFVAAILGGLNSYPLAAAAALLVGTVESFSSYSASAFKEVIVFTIIIPVLFWRSLFSPPAEHHE